MTRRLVVVADDFGIGPETTRGILDLAERRRITATVLLVNSPFAEDAVRAWRRCTTPLELGWHPCLTLDRPVLPPAEVSSLVDAAGRFHGLSSFLLRLQGGMIQLDEAAAELRAQYQRFVELVGRPPTCVNGHHHLQCFPSLRRLLVGIVQAQRPLPYLRRVREPWRMWRGKSLVLSLLGHWGEDRILPGNDWSIQIDDGFASLRSTPGDIVELICHPGHPDPTLAGRDPLITARAREWRVLADAQFPREVRRAGFVLTAPTQVAVRRLAHAA